MTHKEQRQQHHLKERERRKKERAAHQGKGWPIHPGWLLIVGLVGTVTVLTLWTFFYR